MVRCYIALGGNIGPVLKAFAGALAELRAEKEIRVLYRSRLYISQAMLLSAQSASQPNYYNAVCAIDTTLAPFCLLQKLQAIENRYGHNRRVRWAPRTLDLDLLLYGQTCLDTETLIIPHPGLTQRAFVLLPLADIAADVAIGATGKTVQHHVARLKNPWENMIQVITLW